MKTLIKKLSIVAAVLLIACSVVIFTSCDLVDGISNNNSQTNKTETNTDNGSSNGDNATPKIVKTDIKATSDAITMVLNDLGQKNVVAGRSQALIGNSEFGVDYRLYSELEDDNSSLFSLLASTFVSTFVVYGDFMQQIPNFGLEKTIKFSGVDAATSTQPEYTNEALYNLKVVNAYQLVAYTKMTRSADWKELANTDETHKNYTETYYFKSIIDLNNDYSIKNVQFYRYNEHVVDGEENNPTISKDYISIGYKDGKISRSSVINYVNTYTVIGFADYDFEKKIQLDASTSKALDFSNSLDAGGIMTKENYYNAVYNSLNGTFKASILKTEMTTALYAVDSIINAEYSTYEQVVSNAYASVLEAFI